MIHISDDIYKGIAEYLHKQDIYWSGGMGGDDWVFNASIIIYPNEIIPIWYEFVTDDKLNDFSFDKLKEFYKEADPSSGKWVRPVEESSNRKEQAQIAAVENACKRLKEVDRLDFAVAAIADYDNGLTTGFKDGVEWADKTMINAACEWLLHNAHLYVGEFTGDLDEKLLLKEFRKAMGE